MSNSAYFEEGVLHFAYKDMKYKVHIKEGKSF